MKITWTAGIIIAAMFFFGCGGGSDGSSAGFLEVDGVVAEGQVAAGSQLPVALTLDSGQALEDVPVVFSAVKSDDQNNSVYLDSFEISSVAAGCFAYELNVTVPRDIPVGEYTVIANIDPDDMLGDWDDETQFRESETNITVAEHGPDEITVNGAIDAEESEGANVNAAPVLATTAPTITIAATDQNISIDATLTLRPNLAELNATDVNVTACLDIGPECIDLPLWSSEGNGTLSGTLELKDVTNGQDIMVALDTVLPYTEIVKLLDEIKTKVENFEQPLLNSRLVVTLSFNGMEKVNTINADFVPSAELLAALAGGSSPAPSFAPQRSMQASSASCAPKVLDYSKTFEKYKYGDYFGAGAYLTGSAGLDASGLHSRVYASIKAKAMGKKDRFMKLNFTADALPGSFEGTGYDLDIEVLGVSVWTDSESLADVSGLSTPTVTAEEEAAIDLKIKNGDTNLSKTTLIKQKVYKKANKNISTYSGSGSTAVGYVKTWDIGKKSGYTQQFIVGIVPVKITAGAQATVGFVSDIALTGITAIEGSFKPKSGIGAYVQGGVGVIGYSAGVEADLWLVTDNLNNTVTASLDFVEDADQEYIVGIEGNLHEKIYNYFKGPNGKLYLYAEYSVPKYCESYGVRYICGARKKTKYKYLSQWNTSVSKEVLLDEEQTLFTIPLDDCN